MNILISLWEFCGLFAMVKAFLESRGLGKLLVLGAYALTFAAQLALFRMSGDDQPAASLMWGFATLRVLGFGFTYLKLAATD
jgi:hypothetical protein